LRSPKITQINIAKLSQICDQRLLQQTLAAVLYVSMSLLLIHCEFKYKTKWGKNLYA